MKHEHQRTDSNPLSDFPDEQDWLGVEVLSLDEEAQPGRFGSRIVPKTSICGAWIAFFACYGLVAPRGSWLSALGALLGLSMFAIVIIITLRRNSCRDP